MLKVLIVEDEEIIRKGLVYTLDWMDMGCMVVGSAQNGEEGLQMIRGLTPDIVITDIWMPKMNGFEMLEEARKTCSFKSVILTSYSQFEYAKKAIGLRVFEYLLKPVDEEEVRKVVDRIRAELEAEQMEHPQDANLSELESWNLLQNSAGISDPYVRRVLDRIAAGYGERLSVESIAEELGISSSYLSRKFKEATGHTFLDFLHRCRIQKAIQYLRKGTYRIYEVSDLTGFSEYKHFCSVFKKYTGMSPTEFVKDSQKIIPKP